MAPPEPTSPSRPRADAVLDALGDPNRRRVLEIVAGATRPIRVQDIADRLPISRSAVSRHLRMLARAGLVEHGASGAERLYRLRSDGVTALQAFAGHLDQQLGRQLDRQPPG